MKTIRRIWDNTINLGRLQIIIICAFSLVFSTLSTTYDTLLRSHYKTMVLTLNYDGAKDGLTPEGGRFDITQIVSDEVVEDAIKTLGDNRLNVNHLKDRISIESKMPKSSIDKVVAALTAGSTYSYTPAEFTICYSQKDKFGANNTVAFLKALSESYTDFFYSHYSNNNTILQYDETEDYTGYDYDEISQILSDRIDSTIKYLGAQQKENSTYVSSDTGYTYSELINILLNIKEIDIAKLKAYVMQNKVSKNKDVLLRKHNLLISEEKKSYDSAYGTSGIINDALKIYDSGITGVIFVPAVDEKQEFYMGRTKTGLDNLVKRSYDEGTKAIDVKKTIDEYEEKYDLFSASPVASKEQREVAELLISNIRKHLKTVSDLAIKTDNEYVERKTNKYLSFKLPNDSSVSITYFVKKFILALIFAFVAFKGWDIFCRILKEYYYIVKNKIMR